MPLTAVLVRDFAALRDLEPSWFAALKDVVAPSPTILPAWSYGLMARHASAGGFHILAIHNSSRLVLCLPYLVETYGRQPLIRAACEITPVLCPVPSAELFERAFDILTALHGRHALAIEHAETGRAEVACLIAAARRRYVVSELRRSDTNVVLDLSSGWPVVRDSLSANTKEALRRARSRLTSAALRAELRTFARPEEMAEAFALTLAIDSRSWKQVRGGAMTRSANEHAQLCFSFQRLSITGHARIFILTLNDRAAAFILAVVIDGRAYMAVWSYDDAFSFCSPGRLIMEATLSELAACGVSEVDFWGRRDDFKTSWGQSGVIRDSLTFHPNRITFLVARYTAKIADPMLRFLNGPADRYRLRIDKPSSMERVVSPFSAILRRRRLARTARTVDIVSADRSKSTSVLCRPATHPDKIHLPRQLFGDVDNWRVFELDGCVIAAARVELWPDYSLHVSNLWIGRFENDLICACAIALLHCYPQARRLREPTGEIALATNGGLGASLLANRERRG